VSFAETRILYEATFEETMMKPETNCLVLMLRLVTGTAAAQPWGCYAPKPGHPTALEKTQ
jgi:hypothetical protein